MFSLVSCMLILHYVDIIGRGFFAPSSILYYVNISDSAVSLVMKKCTCNFFVCGIVGLEYTLSCVRLWLLCGVEKNR